MRKDNVRILRDSGYEFEGFLDSHLSDFLSGSIIIAQRPGVSNEKLLLPLVRLVLNKDATIILPLSQPEHSLSKSNFSHSTILPDVSLDGPLASQHIYEFHNSHNQDSASAMLTRFRYHYILDSKSDSTLIFLVDTLQRWAIPFENELRHLIHEAPLSNISVWLHCPLYLVPTDLIPTIGSILIISPTKGEIEILRNHMTAKEMPQEDLSNGVLFVRRDSYEFRRMSRVYITS